MAQLVVTLPESGDQVLNLKLGVNRIGRSPKGDFVIDHPTISALHCEITVENDGLLLRDCDSTNGTYVGGKRVSEARLGTGDRFVMGEVPIRVESTEVIIAIPKFDVPRPEPPVVLADGTLQCPRHPERQVTHQCTHCLEVLCDVCVKRLRRRGGKVLRLCPLCSHPCQPLQAEPKRKRSLLGFLKRTVKMSFSGKRRTPE